MTDNGENELLLKAKAMSVQLPSEHRVIGSQLTIDSAKRDRLRHIGHSVPSAHDFSVQFPVPNNSIHLNPNQSEFSRPEETFETCQTHNRKLEAFCFKCTKFLCLGCLIDNRHSSHKVTEIESAFSAVCKDISQRLSLFYKTDKFNCELLNEQAEQATDSVTSNYNYAVKKIDLFFNEMFNSLNERKNELLSDLL